MKIKNKHYYFVLFLHCSNQGCPFISCYHRMMHQMLRIIEKFWKKVNFQKCHNIKRKETLEIISKALKHSVFVSALKIDYRRRYVRYQAKLSVCTASKYIQIHSLNSRIVCPYSLFISMAAIATIRRGENVGVACICYILP